MKTKKLKGGNIATFAISETKIPVVAITFKNEPTEADIAAAEAHAKTLKATK